MAVTVQLRSGAQSDLIAQVAFFMYYVYIIYSVKCDRYYIGYAENVEQRLARHNRGVVTAKSSRVYVQHPTDKSM